MSDLEERYERHQALVLKGDAHLALIDYVQRPIGRCVELLAEAGIRVSPLDGELGEGRLYEFSQRLAALVDQAEVAIDRLPAGPSAEKANAAFSVLYFLGEMVTETAILGLKIGDGKAARPVMATLTAAKTLIWHRQLLEAEPVGVT